MGYFVKAAAVDRFIFLDSVILSKGSYTNRCKVVHGTGKTWITVPVHRPSGLATLICEATIAEHTWPDTFKRKVQSYYAASAYFGECNAWLSQLIDECLTIESMAELNLKIIESTFAIFGLDNLSTLSSSTILEGRQLHGPELVMELWGKSKCKTYLSGPSGRNYLQEPKPGMVFVDFMQILTSLDSDVDWDVSVLDLLMNKGVEQTRAYLNAAAVATRQLL